MEHVTDRAVLPSVLTYAEVGPERLYSFRQAMLCGLSAGACATFVSVPLIFLGGPMLVVPAYGLHVGFVTARRASTRRVLLGIVGNLTAGSFVGGGCLVGWLLWRANCHALSTEGLSVLTLTVLVTTAAFVLPGLIGTAIALWLPPVQTRSIWGREQAARAAAERLDDFVTARPPVKLG